MPSTRVEFWEKKFAATIARDARQQTELTSLGWRVLVIWQCELRDPVAVSGRLVKATSDNCSSTNC